MKEMSFLVLLPLDIKLNYIKSFYFSVAIEFTNYGHITLVRFKFISEPDSVQFEPTF